MYSYVAYGLGIRSPFPLPELITAEAEADVVIRLGHQDHLPSEVLGQAWHIRVTPKEAVLSFEKVGVFLVREGKEITVIPAQDADERLLRLYILGNVLGVLLYQRGLLVLHASAVQVQGGVCAFLGAPGWGKSSLAAALHARGHSIVADDLTPVNLGPTTVLPGFPQLKLNPEAATSLGYDVASSLLLHPDEEKRGYRVTNGFSMKPLSLEHVYILSDGPAPEIERLQPQEAVIELVRHSFPTRLLQPGNALHLFQCATLVKGVPIYRLKRPHALPLLPELARLVENHLVMQHVVA